MPKLVLIVEDDVDTRAIYADAFQGRGYRVISATNGAEGVHLARTHRPDVILLDIRMPVMNGFQAMKYLGAYRETASIPVCAISAYNNELDTPPSHRTGFSRYLTKPLDPAEVVSEVEYLIGPPVG